MSMLAEDLSYTHSRHMEQKTQRRLASNRHGVLSPEAPANHAMTMEPGELGGPGRHNISAASGYDDLGLLVSGTPHLLQNMIIGPNSL